MKIYDISLPLNPDLPVWPGDPGVVLERFRAISEGNISNDSRLACSVHSGTHVDAPIHFLEDGSSVEQLPLDALVGSAEVMEIRNADLITPEILERAGLPGETTRLLIKTRNSELWADPHHAFTPDFAALSSRAARWIVKKGIRLVGVDYLSVQRFGDKDCATHHVLLAAGVVILEGLDLRKITPGPYQLICLPIKLSGSDGAPARAILIEE